MTGAKATSAVALAAREEKASEQKAPVDLRPFTIILWLLFVILCPFVLSIEDCFIAFIFAIGGALAGHLAIRSPDAAERTFTRRTFHFGFALRIVAVLVVWKWMVLFEGGDPWRGGTLDDSGYDRLGWGLAQNWHAGGPLFPADMVSEGYEIRNYGYQVGFHYFTGIIYYFIGRYTIALRILNAFMGAAIVPLVYYIAKSLYRCRRVASRAAFWCAIFPPLILFSSQHLKDASVAFLITFVAWQACEIRALRRTAPKVIAILCGLLALFFLRNQTTFLLVTLLGALFLRD